MIIKVSDWKDHRAKHNLVNPWWFKWHNAHALNVKFLPLKMREIMALVYVLSLASESNSASVNISWEHQQVFGRMSKNDFIEACLILQEFGILEIIRSELGENPAEIRPISGQNIPSREEKRREEKNIKPDSGTNPASENRTLIPFEEIESSVPIKKPRVQKEPPSLEVIPEFEGLREILESRKVTNALQQKWLKAYPPQFIFSTVRAADSWATAKGKNYPNGGLFLNNWLAREFKGRQFLKTQEPKPEQPKRKHFWVQQEEERMAREREQGGGQ